MPPKVGPVEARRPTMSAPDQNDDEADGGTDPGVPRLRPGETPSERLRSDVRDLTTRVVGLEDNAKDVWKELEKRRESNAGIRDRVGNHETATGTRFSALELQLAVNTRLTQEVVTWSRWTIGLLIGLVGLGFTVLWNVLHR